MDERRKKLEDELKGLKKLYKEHVNLINEHVNELEAKIEIITQEQIAILRKDCGFVYGRDLGIQTKKWTGALRYDKLKPNIFLADTPDPDIPLMHITGEALQEFLAHGFLLRGELFKLVEDHDIRMIVENKDVLSFFEEQAEIVAKREGVTIKDAYSPSENPFVLVFVASHAKHLMQAVKDHITRDNTQTLIIYR